MKKNRIIIIGRNYTSRLGMIRALGVLGYEILVIRTTNKISSNRKKNIDIDGYSKYVSGYYFAIEPDRENLLSVIKSLILPNSPKAILVPVDDFAASTIDLYYKDLADYFYMPHINGGQGEITRLMDKKVQKQYAEKVGLRVAKAWTIFSENGKYNIPNDITYPCFPKPQISVLGNKRCMKKCNNEEELRAAIAQVTFYKPDCPFIIEEYVNIEKEYATLGYSDGDNVYLPGMIQMLRDGSGPHKGVTMIGKVIPYEQFHELFDRFADFIKSLNFVGLFDIDSYESNGQIYFNELNLRFGASGFSITANGVNLPELMVNHFLGLPVRAKEECLIKKESIFLNEKVLYEDFQGGYIGLGKAKDYLRQCDMRFLKNEKDNAPYRRFLYMTVPRIVKRILKNL